MSSPAPITAPSYPINANNGRIDLSKGQLGSYLPVYDYTVLNPPTTNNKFTKEAVQGVVLATPLSALFFSKENIDVLQEGVRYKVYMLSGDQKIVVSRQSDMELKVVMRGIFFQYALHQPTDIIGQVKELNGRVLDYAAPNVLSNAQQYQTFRKDITTLPVPMARSSSTNKIGTNPLIMKQY